MYSFYRMDIDQNSRKLAEEFFKIMDPDYYEFEGKIIPAIYPERLSSNNIVYVYIQSIHDTH